MAFFAKVHGIGVRNLFRELIELFDQQITFRADDDGSGFSNPIIRMGSVAPLIDQLSLHQQMALASATGRGLLIQSEPPLEANLLTVSFVRFLFYAYLPNLLEDECKSADPRQQYFREQHEDFEKQVQKDRDAMIECGQAPPEGSMAVVEAMCFSMKETNRKAVKHDRRWKKISKQRARDLTNPSNDQKVAEMIQRASSYEVPDPTDSADDGLEERSADNSDQDLSHMFRSIILSALSDFAPEGTLPIEESRYDVWMTALQLILSQVQQPSHTDQCSTFALAVAKADMLRGPIQIHTKAWDLVLAVAERETSKFDDVWTLDDCKFDLIVMSILSSSGWRMERIDDFTGIEAEFNPMGLPDLDSIVIAQLCDDPRSVMQVCYRFGVRSEDEALHCLQPSWYSLAPCKSGNDELHWRNIFARHMLDKEMTIRWTQMYFQVVRGEHHNLEHCLAALRKIPPRLLNIHGWDNKSPTDRGKRWFDLTPLEHVWRRDSGATLKECALCGLQEERGGPKMQCCGSCRAASYCSAEHQKQHWAKHKIMCNILTARPKGL